MPDEHDIKQQPDEDVEGHAARGRYRNDDGPPPDRVEREQALPDADDDVEGHGVRVRF